MSGGFTGKILKVNLSTKKISHETLNWDEARDFIGAKGLGAKMLFDHLPPKTDPLSPENILMFTTGPLTGTKAQTSGRGTVVTKSPQTGLFLDSHFGGYFAMEQKKAGWDMILVTGKSPTPVYITIVDEHVELKDASSLWGKECLQTHEWLHNQEGKVKTAVIGPAGEHAVKFAAITIDGHRHAGRGGSGAVMGSKNLKAVTVKGSHTIALDDAEHFNQTAKEVRQKIMDNDFIPTRRKLGTPYLVKLINEWGFLPTRNFQDGSFEHAKDIDADTMQKRIVVGSGACYNCVIACWNKSQIKTGPYKGTSLIGPEYETLALMGSNLGMKTIEDVAYLNERCNELGMDTISLGVVMSFAIEAYHKGVISRKDLDNIGFDWGKTKELAALLKMIAYRKNKVADILAEGVKSASQVLGHDSQNYAMHVKGLEIPGYDPRGVFGMGLAYATSDRGACHQRAWTAKVEVLDPDLDRFSFKEKASMIKNIQDERASFFSLVLCDFAPISEEDCVGMFNFATGFHHTVDSYLQAGERIWNLIRLFNLREGLDTKQDTLPPRLLQESFSKGQAKGVAMTEKAYQQCLQEYYSLRGWDANGIPTAKKLQQLGLTHYAKQIRVKTDG